MTLKSQRVFLNGYVDEENATKVLADLHEAHQYSQNCPIEFVINSQGGHISDGTAIYSELRSMAERGGGTHRVTTKVRGLCGSIATLIYQAGDERVGGPLDFFVMHESMICCEGEFLSAVRARLKGQEAWDDMYLDVLMERAKQPRSIIDALSGPFDRMVPMEEAVRLGLADRVA